MQDGATAGAFFKTGGVSGPAELGSIIEAVEKGKKCKK